MYSTTFLHACTAPEEGKQFMEDVFRLTYNLSTGRRTHWGTRRNSLP